MKDAVGLASERLVLRRFTRDDLPLLMRLNSDPEVMRHLGGVLDQARVEEMLDNRLIRYYAEHPGFGIWAGCLKATGECIGMYGLNDVHGEPLVQIGFRCLREHWGKGFATEMSMALLRYAFVDLGLPLVVGNTLPGNVASKRVLEKCGMQAKGLRTFPHPKYTKYGALAYYEAHAGDWLQWSKAA